MSVSYLRVLALTVLLSACATSQGPSETSSSASATPSVELALTPRLSTPPAANLPPPFAGPQVVFLPGSSSVPATATSVLDDIAAKLKADPLVNVVLIGHTEDLGSAEFAVAIAGRCTQAVSQELIKRGARPSQIRMLSRGNESSLTRCNGACQKQMRHVDIVLSQY